jgi:hypothetical protein
MNKKTKLTTSFIFDLAFVAALLEALPEGAKLRVPCFAEAFLAGVFFAAG